MKHVKLEEAVGKTIAKIHENYDNDMFIIFTDGTYGYVKAKQEYDCVSLTEYHGQLSLSVQREVGMITKEQEMEIYLKQQEEQATRQREADLRTLAALKKKYPEA